MKMFSDCSGECCVCACGSGACLAGHGDDDYSPASKDEIIRRLDEGQYKSYRQYMIDYLKNSFGYEYVPKPRKNREDFVKTIQDRQRTQLKAMLSLNKKELDAAIDKILDLIDDYTSDSARCASHCITLTVIVQLVDNVADVFYDAKQPIFSMDVKLMSILQAYLKELGMDAKATSYEKDPYHITMTIGW